MHRISNLTINNARILLAEDNKINQMLAISMLEDVGCIITLAINGKEAVNLYQQEKFDLIFMDCQMPEMDGYEATNKIREYEQQAQLTKAIIVAFTANDNPDDVSKCLECGMDDHIAKPINPEYVESILRKYIADKIVD